MADLSGLYGDKKQPLLGAIRQIDDGVSTEGGAASSLSVVTWKRGACPAQRQGKRPSWFIGPNGDVVTIADLPLPGTTRWVSRRKAEVVLAVHAGMLSLQEACARYSLSVDEFFSWQSAIERHGVLALRATQLQQYRHGEGEPGSAGDRYVPRSDSADRFVFTPDDVS